MADDAFCGYNVGCATEEAAIVRLIHILFVLTLCCCEAPDPAPPPLQPRRVVEVQRWTITSSGDELGELVQFEIRDPSGPVVLYRVLDRGGRWVGHADVNGRFTRRVPFEEDEQQIGTWTLARGCALLFGRGEPVELTVQVAEASFDKDG